MSHRGSEPDVGTAEPRHDVAPMRHKTGTMYRMDRKSTPETTKIATYWAHLRDLQYLSRPWQTDVSLGDGSRGTWDALLNIGEPPALPGRLPKFGSSWIVGKNSHV